MALRSIPTSTAWLLFLTGIVSFIAAWQLGWIELFVVAAACLIAILIAIPFVLGHSAVRLVRTITPNRVTVGDQSVAELRATNETSRPTPGILVEERLDDIVTPIEVPSLGPDQSSEFLYRLPTSRRGAFDIGPATVSKGDPLGLLRRAIGETPVERLWVHPRTVVTKPLPAGFAKDLEGPTFDTSPAGDVAFHTIREYAPGDDIRHVHWMSTARKNTLMVRHYVDNRRPELAVVVDTQLGRTEPDLFEQAIEVAASIGTSEIGRGMRVGVRAGGTTLVNTGAASGDDLLDALTLLQATDVEPTVDLGRIAREEPSTAVVVLVTGGRSSDELLAIVEAVRRTVRLVVVNMHEGESPIALPRAKVINATNVDEFAAVWNRLR